MTEVAVYLLKSNQKVLAANQPFRGGSSMACSKSYGDTGKAGPSLDLSRQRMPIRAIVVFSEPRFCLTVSVSRNKAG